MINEGNSNVIDADKALKMIIIITLVNQIRTWNHPLKN